MAQYERNQNIKVDDNGTSYNVTLTRQEAASLNMHANNSAAQLKMLRETILPTAIAEGRAEKFGSKPSAPTQSDEKPASKPLVSLRNPFGGGDKKADDKDKKPSGQIKVREQQPPKQPVVVIGDTLFVQARSMLGNKAIFNQVFEFVGGRYFDKSEEVTADDGTVLGEVGAQVYMQGQKDNVIALEVYLSDANNGVSYAILTSPLLGLRPVEKAQAERRGTLLVVRPNTDASTQVETENLRAEVRILEVESIAVEYSGKTVGGGLITAMTIEVTVWRKDPDLIIDKSDLEDKIPDDFRPLADRDTRIIYWQARQIAQLEMQLNGLPNASEFRELIERLESVENTRRVHWSWIMFVAKLMLQVADHLSIAIDDKIRDQITKMK